jgi:hypothetical protein
MAIKGLVFPKNESEVEPSIQPVVLPDHEDANAAKL